MPNLASDTMSLVVTDTSLVNLKIILGQNLSSVTLESPLLFYLVVKFSSVCMCQRYDQICPLLSSTRGI